jgi:hypothetical protein
VEARYHDSTFVRESPVRRGVYDVAECDCRADPSEGDAVILRTAEEPDIWMRAGCSKADFPAAVCMVDKLGRL